MDNKEIQKSTILSTQAGNGLMDPEQAKGFWSDLYEQTQLGSLVSREMHKVTSGKIHTLNVPGRILRAREENIAHTELNGVEYGQRNYQTVEVRTDWEVSKKQLRENIEGAGFEQTLAGHMLTNIGQDVEDLMINGDQALVPVAPATPTKDEKFVKLQTGFVKQVESGGKQHDAATAKLSLDVFYSAIAKMDNKHFNSSLKWIMSPKTKRAWEAEMLKANITNGGGYIESLANAPAGIQIVVVDKFPENKIILADPKNFVVINTYNLEVQKDEVSADMISRGVIYYTAAFDIDFVIVNPLATLALKNFTI